MLKKWGWLILLVVALVAIAASSPFWLEQLLNFIKVESNRIQALADGIRIVIWIFAGIIMLIAAIRRRRKTAGANKPVTKIEKKQIEKRSVSQPQQSLVVTGDRNTFVLTEEVFSKILGQTAPPENLQQATQRYLQYLTDRYRYLDFKGMGVSDRVPLRLRLQDLYVPLKARIELPKGETWSRELKLAGREIPESEREHLGERLSEPAPLLNLLQKNDCLVILGDPGGGKTTFLKYLTLPHRVVEAQAGSCARWQAALCRRGDIEQTDEIYR